METSAMSHFLANLRDLMEERGLRFEQLGEAVGINPRTIRRWYENRRPKAESVIRISEYFGCSGDFLFGMSEKFEPEPGRARADFYTRYAFLAREAGLNDYKISRLCGIGRGTISKWKSGRIPDLCNLLDLCRLFGCGFDYLVGRSDY